MYVFVPRAMINILWNNIGRFNRWSRFLTYRLLAVYLRKHVIVILGIVKYNFILELPYGLVVMNTSLVSSFLCLLIRQKNQSYRERGKFK